MTCVAALVKGERVWMAGDSCSSSGNFTMAVNNPKVFLAHTQRYSPGVAGTPFLLGFTSSWRMGQILQYELPKLLPPPTQFDLLEYMSTDFIQAVRAALFNGGFVRHDGDGQEVGGEFLVGIRGRLFEINEEYQVLEPKERMAAVGAGAHYALGALWSLSTLTDPERQIRLSMHAAATWCPVVSEPYSVLALPELPDPMAVAMVKRFELAG